MTDSPNWQTCSLGELGEIITGKTPSTKDTENFNGVIPFVKPGDLDRGGNIISTADTLSEKGFSSIPKLPAGAIMVTCIGYLGKVGITTKPSATNQQINSIIPSVNVDTKYLYHYMRSMREWLESESSATTVSIINKSRFSEAPVQLPPLAEQKQIAVKLDDLLAQVDTIKARLDAIPKIIKRFRQSVLAAAVSGWLTEGWREQNGKPEGSLQSIKDICIASFDGPFGSKLKSDDYTDSGVRVVRLENIGHLQFVDEKMTFVSHEKYESLSKNTLMENDILFSSFVDEEVRACLLPSSKEIYINKADCFCLRTDKSKASPKFVAFSLASRNTYDQVKRQVHGATRPRINLGTLKAFEIVVPTVEEQTEIVRRVDQLFAFADQIEQRVKDATARVNHLTQSILAKAFRGELTADWRAQNPDLISGENSGKALLARIRAEREQAPPVRRQRRVKA